VVAVVVGRLQMEVVTVTVVVVKETWQTLLLVAETTVPLSVTVPPLATVIAV
jgi:hypothetical protein